MNKKVAISISAIVLAVTAIITGFCFVFFGNKVVKDVPNSLSIEKIDQDFFLVAEYNNAYQYQFKLEQMIDEAFFPVAVVNSKTNSINLSKQNFNIVAGQIYRFSACYIAENGAGNGTYSNYLQWQPTWDLENVDYEKVDVIDETLVWHHVFGAESYVVSFVDGNGNILTKNANSNSLNTADIPVGKYKIYIVANTSNEYVSPSKTGEGKEFVFSRKNEILNVERDSKNSLTINSTLLVAEFEIYVDGNLKCVLQVENYEIVGDLIVYSFENAGVMLNTVDFGGSIVQIKSIQNGYVLESDFVAIS